jgi:hypothetical protein
MRGKPVTMSTDSIKRAYIFKEADFRNTVYNPAVKGTPAIAPPVTPRPLPRSLQLLSIK